MAGLGRAELRIIRDALGELSKRIRQLEGSEVADVLISNTNWTPGLIPAGGYAVTTVTVTGAETNDIVDVSHDQLGANDVIINGHVQALDTVRIILLNLSPVPVNIVAGNLFIIVTQS